MRRRLPSLSPYDVRLAARTVALAAVALTVGVLVEWITDERGVASPGTGGRSIGLLPLVPIAGAVAVVVALVPAAASGELRALSALGASPWRARLPAIAAASLLALASAGAIAAGGMDVRPLFPVASRASDVRVEQTADGPTFVSDRRRVRVDVDGVLVRTSDEPAPTDAPSLPRYARGAVALAVAAAGIALAAWVSGPLRRRPLRALLVGTGYAIAQIAAFQAAGAHALPALVTAAPPLALLVVAWVEHRAMRALGRAPA